jgi:probable rRNA maturation factor
MSSRRKRSQQLDVTVQFATRRTGVPHATSLAKWANLAFDASQSRKPASMPLTIRIVGAAESRILNRTWRGKDKPTNVLSFPADSRVGMPAAVNLEEQLPLGDLAICAPVVAREAREQGKDPRAHWAHMVVHGVLHLLGYDHETDRDADVMESREVKILAEFGYANPYA